MNKTTCRLCVSASLAVVSELNPMPLVDVYSHKPNTQPLYPLGLQMCRGCGHIQLGEVIAADALFESEYLFRTADYPWLVEHYERYAIEAAQEFSPYNVLEIGSNDGTLLKIFADRGCKVLGVDPSGVPASVQTVNARFDVQTQIYIADHLHMDSFSLIIANHVFAHNDDLAEIVRGIKGLLAKDGVFIFETNSGLDLLEDHLFDIVYHEHMDYHTVSPLVRFFARFGLQMFRVEHNESKGGTLRGYACHAGERLAEPSVRIAMELEEAVGATKPGIFREFNERLEQRRKRVLDQLGDELFVGYGAAAGGIATLYHLGLERRCKWIVDDSPRRHGMYAPHCNAVVRGPETLYPQLDSKIVILSWRYAERIKAKHPNLKFIVP